MATTTTHTSSLKLKSEAKTSPYLSTLRHLTNKDVKKAAYTLLEAFAEDSLAKMLVCHIKDPKERKICELTLYEAYLRQHIAKGIVIGQGETESGFETVSIWSHPQSEQDGLDSYNNLMEAGKGNVRKLFDYMFKNYIDKEEDNIAYLESSSPVNIPIYNRFDFHVVEDIILGSKFDGAVEGQDYAIMHVMIRGSHGHDWTQDENTLASKL
ncbi:putative N-acetyltransferase [Candida tropicalis]